MNHLKTMLCIGALLAPFPANAAAEASRSVQPVRQADAACAACHPGEFRTYLETPMANASGPASERGLTGQFRQSAAGIEYTVKREDGQLWLHFARKSEAPLEGRRKLEYFLGSGHLGLTYLYRMNGYLLESPVAYYANSAGYDMKPGLSAAAEMPPALPMTRGCMRCHMSDVQREDAGTTNHFRDLPFLKGGITCESCHGDTQAHIATKGKASVVNPLKLSPERRDSVCILCHLEGETRIEHTGRQVDDFKPGDRIDDYLSYFVLSSDRLSNRGVTEIEQLSFSRCKRASGSRLSCMSCHNPHYSPAAAEKAAFYRAKCLACHTQPQFSREHFSGTPDCTSCHMPKAPAERVPHIAWTDHRIRRVPDDSKPLTQADDGGTTLVAFPENTKVPARDLALAYYDLVLGGNDSLRGKAWEQLLAVHRAEQPDLAVANSLAYLAQKRGDDTQAAAFYGEALNIDPLNVNAANNLAILLARAGQLTPAERLWQAVFERNEDLDQPGFNLAIAECMLGKRESAEAVLERVLLYSPDQRRARRKLAAIRSGEETCNAPPQPGTR